MNDPTRGERSTTSDPTSANGPQASRLPSDLNPRRDPSLDFPDRDLGEMSPGDYRELGFMSGLEVHQQLITRKKLFCRCPAGRYVTHFDAEVLRHMRPTLSELGEYDGTALMEFKTKKEIVYLLERGTVCTYEMDDTPPFEIDREAVLIALEICQLFDLKLVAELHVMRKQYLDGSIPTGFQRTVMMGLDGVIPFTAPELGVAKDLRIRQLSLEEDSCREVSDIGHRITFRTDRLGMPLTEVVTEPDLLTPWELQAGARLVARVTRAGGKVRRGPGAARQDVNVSVAGGRRVELKGVGHHRGLPLLVHVEGFRQLNLLRIRAELERRGVASGMLAGPREGSPWRSGPLVADAGSILRRCDYTPIRDALDRGDTIAAVRLPGFAGLLNHRTQPGVAFANEIADRLRVVACLTARPFMIHSHMEGHGLRHSEWRQLSVLLGAESGDTVIILWGPETDADTAVREVFIRAREALAGVPSETRQAFPDGTSGFERILPGPDRMYPDTDTPPVPIPDAWVEEIRAQLPERPWEREARYAELGLDPRSARRLIDSPWARLFEDLAPEPGLPARRLASAMEKRFPAARRRSRKGENGLPDRASIAPLVRALERGELRPEGIEVALDRLLASEGADAERILDELRPCGDGDRELEELVEGAAARAVERMAVKPLDKILRWTMGQVMRPLRGRVDPALVRARLTAALKLVLEGVGADGGHAVPGDRRTPGQG